MHAFSNGASHRLLQTPRTTLRGFREGDLDRLAALTADPEVMRFFPAPLSRAESDAFAARIEAQFEAQGVGLWVVEVPGVTPFAGLTGIFHHTWEAPFTPCFEIGWRLFPAYWGRGLATEAARAALRYGFQARGLPEIVSFTARVNERSVALMRRLGMEPDGEFEHPRLPPGHWLRPHVLYRLRAEAAL